MHLCLSVVAFDLVFVRLCSDTREFFWCCCVYAGVRLVSADWGTWILHTECVNSGWTPGCTVSGTLWQPRPNDPARDCTVHREVLYSRTPSSHSHLSPDPLSVLPAPSFTSLLYPPSPSLPSCCVFLQPSLLFLSLFISITLLSTRQKLSAGILRRRVPQTCQRRQNVFKYQTLTRLSGLWNWFLCGKQNVPWYRGSSFQKMNSDVILRI